MIASNRENQFKSSHARFLTKRWQYLVSLSPSLKWVHSIAMQKAVMWARGPSFLCMMRFFWDGIIEDVIREQHFMSFFSDFIDFRGRVCSSIDLQLHYLEVDSNLRYCSFKEANFFLGLSLCYLGYGSNGCCTFCYSLSSLLVQGNCYVPVAQPEIGKVLASVVELDVPWCLVVMHIKITKRKQFVWKKMLLILKFYLMRV